MAKAKPKGKRVDPAAEFKRIAPVHVHVDLAATIEAAAREENRSVQSWCRLAFIAALREQGYDIPDDWAGTRTSK